MRCLERKSNKFYSSTETKCAFNSVKEPLSLISARILIVRIRAVIINMVPKQAVFRKLEANSRPLRVIYNNLFCLY